MIQINLIPDVKRELLKVRKMRTLVTSAAIIVAIVAGGVVTLLAMYVFGAQTFMNSQADAAIDDEYKKLSQVEDLSKTLTIQNQLTQLTKVHGQKIKSSRLFDILSATAPDKGENKVTISRTLVDTEANTITIEATASGYRAVEVFKKTISQTKFEYSEQGETKSVDIASAITDGDRGYGQNARGDRVLRFEFSFEYPDELFSSTVQNGRIVTPTKRNVTDSVQGVPKSLFGSSTGEGE